MSKLISNKTFWILSIVALVIISLASANVLPPTSWGRGFKLYNNNGSYWDLMGEQGMRNGSLTNISYIQLNKTAVAPQLVNGTMWLNSSSGLPNYYWNGTNYSINVTVI